MLGGRRAYLVVQGVNYPELPGDHTERPFASDLADHIISG